METTMKLLVITAILSIVAGSVNSQGAAQIPEEQRQRILEYATVCAAQHSIDKVAIQALKSGKFDNANQNAKCFTNCFLEKAGLIVNGQTQDSVILEKLGRIFGIDKVKTAMSNCNSLKYADNCETAFELYKCYYKTNAVLI